MSDGTLQVGLPGLAPAVQWLSLRRTGDWYGPDEGRAQHILPLAFDFVADRRAPART